MNYEELTSNFQILNQNIYLQQLSILLIYALIAKAADLFIDRVLRRLAGYTKMTFDDELINFAHGPICWTIFLLGLQHTLLLHPLQPPWLTVLPAVVKSAILLTWFIAFIRAFNWLADLNLAKVVTRGKIGKDLFLLLKNVLRVVTGVAGLLWLLAIWKVDLTPLFASAGIAGIAVALAAKDTLANFFGGISIFADNTFKVGDYIILDNAERGEVVEIGIRSTRIKTRDDVLITIPNSLLATSKIINESAPVPSFRIRIPVGIAYGSDLDQVERVLLAVADANGSILKEPAPRVRVRAFADSSVNFELLLWVADPRVKGLETHNLLKSIYRAFADNNITIPFPQRDLHFIPAPEANGQESAASRP
ncbi:MAG: mechanosensitive ion channel family protein [Desulfobulbaceae bacterium]|nr:mechanosensitive ion channel family protein [Desulfobulbaceae bacterium]